jgi:methionyl-tRNA synthetase
MPKTLITCALPYANGPLHLGHMVEHIQTDAYVRFLRSCGEDVVFLCADDTHGTPIELSAQKAGKTPEEFVARFHEEHQKDLKDFDVVFDYFHSTNSPENKHFAELIYGRLNEAGLIGRKDVEQAFDPKANRFLPDRFIRGTCPNCKSPDQYGDACEVCLKTYGPKDLIDPYSAISKEKPVWKSSEHLFFQLPKLEKFLADQIVKPGFMNPGLAQQLKQFFAAGLADWDISRDGPYFGFAIPGETNKFFYVWLDAPIGYIATAEKWAKETGKAKGALDYWAEGADSRVIHFIGKDIVYFHCLFWPAVLKTARLKVPDRVHIHGHLTVNGEKMSKARGTFINARPYLELLDPNYLRFFYATLLGPGAEDLDLSLKEFRERVNGELVNNICNLASRLKLLGSLESRLSAAPNEKGEALVRAALARVPEIRAAFEAVDLRSAMKVILEIGSSANAYLQIEQPWKTIKTEPESARAALTAAADIVYLLSALLAPIVPKLTEKMRAQLNARALTFQALKDARYPLLDRSRPVSDAAPIIGRIEEAVVSKLVQGPEITDEKTQPSARALKVADEKKPAPAAPAGPPPEIDYTDFARVELRVGNIVAAEKVPKADKLLKLTVNVGEAAPRTIVSGIAEAYAPEAVVGKNVVVVMNLKPRALKGIESKGMLLTAGPGGKDLVLLDPGQQPPGAEVK